MSTIDSVNSTDVKERKRLSSTVILFIFLGAMVLVFAVFSKDFYSSYNITSMITNLAYTGIVSAALTFILITGGLDISIGGNIAVTSCAVAALYNMPNHLPVGIILIIGLLIGAVIGSINGVLVTTLDLNPIITTLGTMSMATGMAYVISKSRSILMMEDVTGFIGRGQLAGIPTPIIWLTAVYVVLALVLARSKFGRKVYCIGANEEAARISGIRVKKVKYILYLMSGVAASFSGIILVGQTAVGMPQHGVGSELDMIAAVLLGGTVLSGGKGNIMGTLAGALILSVLYNGFTMVGFKWVHIRVFQGILLVAVVALYEMRDRKKY